MFQCYQFFLWAILFIKQVGYFVTVMQTFCLSHIYVSIRLERLSTFKLIALFFLSPQFYSFNLLSFQISDRSSLSMSVNDQLVNKAKKRVYQVPSSQISQCNFNVCSLICKAVITKYLYVLMMYCLLPLQKSIILCFEIYNHKKCKCLIFKLDILLLIT